jgi:lysozyme family protein
MAIFDNQVMDLIIKWEGGYSDDPDDPGGETKYGITKRSYPNLDIKNLTVELAYEIYNRDFWKFYKLSTINDQTVANKLMLALINMSPKYAIRGIQFAVSKASMPILIDGILGDETIKAINYCNGSLLFMEYLRLSYVRIYQARVEENRKKEKYLFGWIRRALI